MPDIFQEAGLPLWLRPYEVLVTSSYTALIETIPDTVNFVLPILTPVFLLIWVTHPLIIDDLSHRHQFTQLRVDIPMSTV